MEKIDRVIKLLDIALLTIENYPKQDSTPGAVSKGTHYDPTDPYNYANVQHKTVMLIKEQVIKIKENKQ